MYVKAYGRHRGAIRRRIYALLLQKIAAYKTIKIMCLVFSMIDTKLK